MLPLQRYTLEPVAEATADKRSFSARKCRTPLDAHAYLQRDLESELAPELIVKIDVEAYYSNIAHKYLLDIIPMNKQILRKQLKAGVIKDGLLFDTEQGISLGGSLSPVLANMMLNGLQTYIYDRLYPNGHVNYLNGNMTRYADDTIILAESENMANLIYQIVSEFLAERGLRPNNEKSGLFHIREGFVFLGRHYQKRGNILLITPSDNSVTQFEHKLSDLILRSNTTYKTLIETVNTELSQWANNYRSSDAYMIFRHIDAVVEAYLFRRVYDRHPRWSREAIRDYYFIKDGAHYIFVHPKDPALRVIRLAPLNIIHHKPCKLDLNPFLDKEYFTYLKKRRDMQKAVGRYTPIWRRQDGRCAYCGLRMQPDQEVEVIERTIGKGWRTQNLIYIHTRCRYDMLSRASVDSLNHVDLFELLEDVLNDRPLSRSPYWGLREFFRLCEKPVVTLTFAEIEAMIGEKLGWEAEIYEEFWSDGCQPEQAGTGWRDTPGFVANPSIKPEAPECRIADAWISQGYRLQRLHLMRRRAVFHRAIYGTNGLRIPAKLIQNRIPEDAVYELKMFFDHIICKYGL